MDISRLFGLRNPIVISPRSNRVKIQLTIVYYSPAHKAANHIAAKEQRVCLITFIGLLADRCGFIEDYHLPL